MRTTLQIDVSPRNVFAALRSMNLVHTQLRRQRDPRAVFPDVYAVITRRVADEVAKGEDSLFLEPAWISRLAGLFAVRYFDSLTASFDDGTQRSGAWRLAYHFAAQGRTLPCHDALFGINAHINFDLAQGIYDNIIASGHGDDPRMLARYRHDHDAVNQILEAALPECLAILANRYACPMTRLITRNKRLQAVVSSLMLSTLKLWRDRVWRDVLELLAAKRNGETAAILARMNRDSSLIAQVIGLTSSLFSAQRERSRAMRAGTSVDAMGFSAAN